MSVLVKYCGCQTEEDYRLLSATKANIIGFVFAESKRKVRGEEVSSWMRSYGKEKELAGVFQNASVDEILHVVSQVPLDIIQCHGHETVETLIQLKKQCSTKIYKAIAYGEDVIDQIALYAECADAIVVDSVSDGQFGGTGVPFAWTEIPQFIKKANKYNIPIIIAGGITPENIHTLLEYHPDGIDISGGIEREGKKCGIRIKKLEGMM
ncbi:phosphoribosylanthranilate isomerase [Fictibacillus nanhaiensis]|uniref:phosphoribosylanthranilate isomerase n=1 Tax=Fictibacillus nanhaiensis TaxID=742169 RepID=UPI001C9763A7|nr:phosphoribosylanthranilate isomerase [Fictibacillus nanhaiensis]MBY6035698.1 phosphoribosylanthranilate isomerase [Fictibacillus nanhaiensis]